MLAPLTSWLTPGSLFLLLNIVIGTIYLTSRFTSTRRPQPQPGPEYPPPLARSPSLLQRVKSIDFSFHKYNQPNQDPPINNTPDQYTTPPPFERKPSRFSTNSQDPNPDEAPGPEFQPPARTRSILERVKSIDFASFYRSDSIKTESESESESVPDPTREPDHVIRTRSENPVTQLRIPEMMKRSASENWEKEDEEIEEIERIRPATTRIERTVSIGEGVDVDLKADHFINKFKQQLKLQRLDSLLRYKEMIMGKK